jgi:hypothetical protein
MPGVLTGSTWSAKNASSRQIPPTTPGKIEPGFQSSIGQPEDAERQQQVGDLRVRDRAEHPLRPGLLDPLEAWRRRSAASRSGHRTGDRPAVELRQQVGQVGGDDVDERRVRPRAPRPR